MPRIPHIRPPLAPRLRPGQALVCGFLFSVAAVAATAILDRSALNPDAQIDWAALLPPFSNSVVLEAPFSISVADSGELTATVESGEALRITRAAGVNGAAVLWKLAGSRLRISFGRPIRGFGASILASPVSAGWIRIDTFDTGGRLAGTATWRAVDSWTFVGFTSPDAEIASVSIYSAAGAALWISNPLLAVRENTGAYLFTPLARALQKTGEKCL